MKATELMIGDWICSSINDINVRIAPADLNWDNAHTEWLANSKPIPLNAEILEKNGFKEYNGYGYTSNKGYIFKEFYINNDFTIKTANIDCKINFVHELQHALKLCGIEKEIQL